MIRAQEHNLPPGTSVATSLKWQGRNPSVVTVAWEDIDGTLAATLPLYYPLCKAGRRLAKQTGWFTETGCVMSYGYYFSCLCGSLSAIAESLFFGRHRKLSLNPIFIGRRSRRLSLNIVIFLESIGSFLQLSCQGSLDHISSEENFSCVMTYRGRHSLPYLFLSPLLYVYISTQYGFRFPFER